MVVDDRCFRREENDGVWIVVSWCVYACLWCRSGTYFCMDKSVTAVVIKGLAEHKDELGAPLCPCRHYDDKQAEADQGYWNCPCVPMRERKVRIVVVSFALVCV